MLENPLSICLNRVSMAPNDLLKIPLINSLHRLRESDSIPTANPIPYQPLLRIPLRTRQRAKHLREDARCWAESCLAVLLHGRIVEHEIGLDQGLGWAMEEDDFLILMPVHVFVVEFGVEFGVDRCDGIVLGKDMSKGDVLILLRCSLLWETLWTKDFCGRIGLRPGTEVDMMLGYTLA